MSATTAPACRVFEDRLAERGLVPGTPETDALATDPHAASCTGCGALVAILGENAATFRMIGAPVLPPDLFARLVGLPTDLAGRNEAARVLEYLRPGSLLAPQPPPELFSRLAFLPARARAERPSREAGRRRTLVQRLAGDWRTSVALAYAAALLVVVALGVDPLTAARDAASDLTASGEKALVEARTAAVSRISDTSLARAAKPYTERLDFRLYRAVAAGRARAAAYSQLVFEKVFGGALEAPTASSEPALPHGREPAPESLRSLREAHIRARKVTT